MPRCRCRCGAMATTKRPCLACGTDYHLIHCHCADGRNPDVVLEQNHWRNCPKVHAHPYDDGDHVHRESRDYA